MKITLYIKTHKKTGLKYFGKVTGWKDPYIYHGSGKYWRKHLRKHGYDVDTQIVGEFDDIQKCSEFAIRFSAENNIVESEEWANLQIENGIDGAPVGHVGSQPSDETKRLVSEQSKTRWADPEFRARMVEIHKKRWTDELKKRQSDRLKREYWTEDRRLAHSKKLQGRHLGGGIRGVPKPDGFGKKISAALSGKTKSVEHLRNLSQSLQKDRRVLIDHLGNKYELHSDFSKRYNIDFHHFYNLDSRIRLKSSYRKLGIEYETNKTKTKRELGFRLE